MSALGGPNGDDGPGGVALIDHDTFEVIGPWELDRGAQFFAYDVWWHLGYDTVLTSEWGPISMIEKGLDPEDLLGRKFGHHLNFWSMSERKLTQRVDLGDQHQMVLELRPAHDPSKAFGFVGVVISAEDLSASVWLWHQDGDRWSVDKVITIPAEPADADDLPPALKPFGAAPPLVTDIDLSVDDRWLYVSCFGTGELKQYDVSDPFHPRETASVRLGGIVRREPHPAAPDMPLAAGRRWWRSAVTADGSMSPTRSTRPGTRSSTPTASGHGWPSSTPTSPRAVLSPTPRSSRAATTSAAADPPNPAPGRRRIQRLVLLHQLGAPTTARATRHTLIPAKKILTRAQGAGLFDRGAVIPFCLWRRTGAAAYGSRHGEPFRSAGPSAGR